MPKKKKPEITSLYYITHVDNVPSILQEGILSHQLVQDRGINYKSVYDAEIVGNRFLKRVPSGQSLWSFANLYFQPRNPMLFRVTKEKGDKEIAVLGVYRDVLNLGGVFLTDGNAANSPTQFYSSAEGLKAISDNWGIIQSEWWNPLDGSKRKIMAECLIPERVPPNYIHSIYVAHPSVAERVKALIGPRDLPIIPEPFMFFLPRRRYQITERLSLAEGDMFFSNMHTLTVSVNTVGIMGKGLASRAKYQFPDVYVAYQDACRRKTLRMGKPYLYKREASYDDDLADEQLNELETPNGVKWFLLFATKQHWKDNADLAGIEEGMQWLVNNYRKEGIKSIALPALGCGLGNLEWKDVGPVMCRYLTELDISATIYLPREQRLQAEYLLPEYLLAQTN